jgi:hypothetical protein
MKHTLQLIHAFFLATLLAAPGATAAAKPLKVFILAGQSNMEGPASIKTFDYLGWGEGFAPVGKAFP